MNALTASLFKNNLVRVWALLMTGVFSSGLSFTAEAAPRPITNVRLFLHGFNSDATVWNDVVRGWNCPVIRLGTPVPVSNCYRYQFADRTVNGVLWRNGDGASLNQQRLEVQAIVRRILRKVTPTRMLFIGHSRGALAARAYLQDPGTPLPFLAGLVTLGAPNQGTPLGRAAYWLDDRGYSQDQVIDQLRFIFSPAVRWFATDHDANGQLIASPISQRIFNFNALLPNLTINAGSIGELSSSGLRLGENVEGDLDALNDVGAQLLAFLTPGSFDSLLQYILNNIAQINERPILIDTFSCGGARQQQYPWACDGDGVVPAISQQIEQAPTFVQGTAQLFKVNLSGIAHHEEPGRITEVYQLIRQVRDSLIP